MFLYEYSSHYAKIFVIASCLEEAEKLAREQQEHNHLPWRKLEDITGLGDAPFSWAVFTD